MRTRKYRLAVIGTLAATLLGAGVAEAAADEPSVAPKPAAAAADECGLTDKLVPTCEGQALYGGWVKGYPREDDGGAVWARQTRAAVERHGRTLDVVHMYHAPIGDRAYPFEENNSYGDAERDFIDEGRIVLVNFKPAVNAELSFKAGAEGDYNEIFKKLANNIKSVSPAKVMLALSHEPEDNLSEGDCPAEKYRAGNLPGNTGENYREMWRQARRVFDEEQVTNVVWVMNFQGGSQTGAHRYDCMIEEVWPGNDLVDWIAFDIYSRNGSTKSLTRFLDLLATKTAAHAKPDGTNEYNFTSKPYMLAEFGEENCGANDNSPQTKNANRYAPRYYKALKDLLDSKTSPIKAYLVFDAFAETGDHRVSFNPCQTHPADDRESLPDPTEEAAFKNFATDPLLMRLPIANS